MSSAAIALPSERKWALRAKPYAPQQSMTHEPEADRGEHGPGETARNRVQ